MLLLPLKSILQVTESFIFEFLLPYVVFMVLGHKVLISIESLRWSMSCGRVRIWLVHLDVVALELVSFTQPSFANLLPLVAFPLEVALKMLHLG